MLDFVFICYMFSYELPNEATGSLKLQVRISNDSG